MNIKELLNKIKKFGELSKRKAPPSWLHAPKKRFYQNQLDAAIDEFDRKEILEWIKELEKEQKNKKNT